MALSTLWSPSELRNIKDKVQKSLMFKNSKGQTCININGKWTILEPTPNELVTQVLSAENSNIKFSVSSANCAHANIEINNQTYFCKIELGDQVDPLINEVIFLKKLNSLNCPNKCQNNNCDDEIFPEYYTHLLLSNNVIKTNSGLIQKKEEYKALITKAVVQPTSLYRYAKHVLLSTDDNLKSNFLEAIQSLFENFGTIGRTNCFIHGDLHLNNILISGEGEPYIIDFGRSYFGKEPDSIFTDTNIEFENFGIKPPKVEYSAFTFKIDNQPNAYLIDVGSVALNLAQMNLYRNDQLFTYVKNEKILNILIIKDEVDINTSNLTELDKGMLFIICYLNIVADFLNNNNPSKIIIKTIGNKFSINLKSFFQMDIIFSNGYVNFFDSMIKNKIKANQEKSIMEMTFDKINRLLPVTSINGGRKKIKKRGGGKINFEIGKLEDRNINFNEDEHFGMSISDLIYQNEYESELMNASKLNNTSSGTGIMIDLSGFYHALQTFNQIQAAKNTSCVYKISKPIDQDNRPLISAYGGKTKKSCKIYKCSTTARKYIRKDNKRWYLDENRGKYRYTDFSKDKIFINIK